jgi:hypothetical protein
MATLRKMTRVGADVRQIARLLQAKAPENHMLAYITPEEAELLKSRGGSGMPDPQTGIPTYYVPDPEYVDPYALIHMKYPQQDSGFDASANTVPVSESDIVSYAGDTSRPTDSGTTASSYHTGSSPSAYGQPSAFSSFKQETAPSYYMADYAPSAYARAEYPANLGLQQETAPTYYTGGSPSAYARADYPASLGLPPVDASRDRPAPPIDTTPSRTIGERYSDLAKSLGVKEDTLSRIGLAGLQVGLGARQARLAREEARKAKEEQQKLAAPYQAKGAELQRQAQAGELTPAGRQQLQTVQAQAAQAASSRGGVGAQQTAARVEAIRNQLLQQQYDYGLKLSGIGDQILLGSIRTGLEADRYVNQLSNTYFTNVARTLAGSPTVIQYGVPR